MGNKLIRYRTALDPLPATHGAWPLHGAGLPNLGCNRAMTVSPRPDPGPDQILVRNDAAGLCFSDVKVIQMGAGHPRLTGRDLAADPLVPGHEASVTVVAVGAGLTDCYQVGQRFAVQPDIWCDGRSLPYGYALDGAFQQYGVLGREILAGDAGSYLVPIPDELCVRGRRADRTVGVRRSLVPRDLPNDAQSRRPRLVHRRPRRPNRVSAGRDLARRRARSGRPYGPAVRPGWHGCAICAGPARPSYSR